MYFPHVSQEWVGHRLTQLDLHARLIDIRPQPRLGASRRSRRVLSVTSFGTNYPSTLSPPAPLPPSLVSQLFLPKLSSSRRYTRAGGMILPTHPPSSSLQVLRTSMLRWWHGNRNVEHRSSLLKRFTCFGTHCADLLEWRVEGEMSRLNRRYNGEGTDRDIWRTQWDRDRKWRRGCYREKDREVDGSIICWA